MYRYQKCKENKCEICSAVKNLQVHHIDRDRYNDKPENLITLFRRCHYEIHTMKLLNKAETNKYRELVITRVKNRHTAGYFEQRSKNKRYQGLSPAQFKCWLNDNIH